ncbi:hypothetical protein TIFTF001_036761 [Ficus carica]|uniref:Uncharacterized protein n=1 Tax=Ficus carica TaxID=3494 RepID=A0AA88JB63_FICCA|nr:hypothetical protein TIFTF001_036761 [Ficus carica]
MVTIEVVINWYPVGGVGYQSINGRGVTDRYYGKYLIVINW